MTKELDIIYCPFIEVKIKDITCDLLEKFGSFPLQVLLSLSEGHSIKAIAEGIIVAENVIENAVNELEHNNMIEKKMFGKYKLTQTGKKYVRLYTLINDFRNSITEKFAVNCFTCLVEKIGNADYFSNTKIDSSSILYNRLKGSEFLVKSPDYENSHDYFKNLMKLHNSDLTDDDYVCIHFILEPVDKWKVFYVPYAVPENAYSDADSADTAENKIYVKVPVQKARRFYYSPLDQLNDVKALKAALMFLQESYADFLSEKAKTAIEEMKASERYNAESRIIFMDCYSGKEFGNHLQKNQKTQHTDLCLSERHKFKSGLIPVKSEGMDGFFYEYKDEGTENYVITVDFSRLEQIGGDL